MKKETILKSMMLAFMAMSAANVCGQTTWVYSYDNTGNRTQRVVNTGAKARQRAAASPNNLLSDEKISATIDGNRNNIKIEILGLKTTDVAEVAIYDLSGIQVLSRRIESEITSLNLGKLRKGTYILSIVLNGETRSCKFNK
jgi:hypothetical protein